MVAGRHHAGGHPGPGGMWRGSDANGHPGAHRDECNQDDPRRTAGKFVGGGGGGGGDGGRAVPLTNIEYRLLSELSVNAGRALTHEQLLQRVWGPEHSGQPGAVRTFVKNLRRKLGDDADNPNYIHTELRVGYRMPKGEGTEGQATM